VVGALIKPFDPFGVMAEIDRMLGVPGKGALAS
jgi:hypothetical protein